MIVTSATFNADFYQQFFGGEAVAGKIEVPAVKTIGYGWPLFPELDTVPPGEAELRERWEMLLPELPLAEALDEERLVATAWPPKADPLKEGEVREAADAGYEEDLHETTRRLLPLRFQDPLPAHMWKTKMPETLGRFVVKLAKGLDRAGIYGDILGFPADRQEHRGGVRDRPRRGRQRHRRLRADLVASRPRKRPWRSRRGRWATDGRSSSRPTSPRRR